MLRNALWALVALFALALGSASANAQTHPDLGLAVTAATSTIPGFPYRADLGSGTTGLQWEVKIFATNSKAYKVVVDASTNTVLRYAKVYINPLRPTSASVDIVTAGELAVDAIATKRGDSAMVQDIVLMSTLTGNAWVVSLQSLTDSTLTYDVRVNATSGRVRIIG